MPERPAPDPSSLALGRIEGRMEGIEKRLGEVATRAELQGLRAELRGYVTVIFLALALLFATVLRYTG